MNLSIILRTHDQSNVHSNERFIQASKTEIVRKCSTSLFNSIKHYSQQNEISVTVIDDHSSPETVDFLKQSLVDCSCKTKFVELSDTGNSASIKKAYETGLTEKNDLIYFVEDDYFHKVEAVTTMINDWKFFTEKLDKKPVVLVPYDDPLDYLPERLNATRVVFGSRCHWKQCYHSTQTMFMSKWTLMHFWDRFMQFSKYGTEPGINEDNTINLLYSRFGVFLFNPLPFLAFHVCDLPPVVGDWQSLWNS